jgi:type II secretory pathway predicted ATPase ExeA/outer membrane protein OmpA-like peptidoglycan-associated protein
MFESFYGFTDNPFRMSADEHFRYAHRAYVKAWSYLKYALEQGEGFVLITGRPGTGKTTLIRDTLSELDSDSLQAVSLISHQLLGEELLRLVALELGFPAQDFNKATLLTRIGQHALMLHEEGRRIVIIVDEAQNLTPHGLEELRLLSNLQTDNRSLFQIVLIGQEELRNLVYGQGRENIQQRIVTSCRLEPMQLEQIQEYVEYRLGIVGWSGDPSFEPEIHSLIYRITHGVAREINLVMARLLLYGALEKKHAFNRADLLVVLKELLYEQRLAFDQTTLVQELDQSVETETPDTAAETAAVTLEVSEQKSGPGESPDTPAEERGLLDDLDVTAADAVSEATPSQSEAADAEASFLPIWNGSEKATMCGKADQTTVDPEVGLPGLQRSDWSNAVDELPALRATPDEKERSPQGLFTDVGDLSESNSGNAQAARSFWRWIFYPLAIIMLIIALLVPKPSDLPVLWNSLWRQLTSDDGAGNDRQMIREGPDSSMDSIDEPAQATSVSLSRFEEIDTQQEEVKQTAADAKAKQRPVTGVSEASGQEASDQQVADQQASGQQALKREKAVLDTDSNVKIDKHYFLQFHEPNDSLDDRSEQTLAQLVVWLHKNPTAKIKITGILTNGMKPLGRMREALQRAEQISARLVSARISSQRIFIEGGVQNSTPAGAGVSIRIVQ